MSLNDCQWHSSSVIGVWINLYNGMSDTRRIEFTLVLISTVEFQAPTISIKLSGISVDDATYRSTTVSHSRYV